MRIQAKEAKVGMVFSDTGAEITKTHITAKRAIITVMNIDGTEREIKFYYNTDTIDIDDEDE